MRRAVTLVVLAGLLAISLTSLAGAQSTPPSQLTLTISSQGMTPANATVGAGLVHLLVKNSSNVGTLRLRVTQGNGALVKEMTAPNSSEDWAIELELSAGQYTISEASNAAWSCQLTVQAPPAG